MGAPDPRGASHAPVAATSGRRREGPAVLGVPAAQGRQAAGGQGRGLAEDRHRPLLARRPRGQGPDARRPTPIGIRLIRRVSFDLVGLPPSPEEVEAFVADTSADAFTKVVDRLLASPRFGERWGRHWLDVARFAESSGKANMMYPNAWRYRDWVIAVVQRRQALRRVRPRADRRRPPSRRATTASAPSTLIATGFLALGQQDAQHPEPQAIRARPGRRADRRHRPGVSRPDHRLRPLPRPQVRPDHPARLLRALGHLPEHADLLRHAPGRGAEHQSVALDRAARTAPARHRPLPKLTARAPGCARRRNWPSWSRPATR